MILPEFILRSRANQHWLYSGSDSIEYCLNKHHFLNYPYTVDYSHNSRGFRDAEWPVSESELAESVWCFGDSFTVGLGCPAEHTWPHLLGKSLNTRTINVSLDGASNTWIARKIQALTQQVIPKNIVVHWSYLHRREQPVNAELTSMINAHWQVFYNAVKDPGWPECNHVDSLSSLPTAIKNELRDHHIQKNDVDWLSSHLVDFFDEERRRWLVGVEGHIGHMETADSDDLANLTQCVDQVTAACARHNINLVQSFIPNFADPGAQELINRDLINRGARFIPAFPAVDFARDYHHYGIKTAQQLVERIQPLIKVEGAVPQN